MGKAKGKQEAKRRLARCWCNIDRTLDMLALFHQQLEEHHADIADLVDNVGKELVIVQSQLEDIWKICWGELPQDFYSWS